MVDKFYKNEGHSCLIPIDETCVKTLYIFVEIDINIKHLVETLKLNFEDKDTRFY